LCETNGINDAKVCQILAAFELGRLAAFLFPDDQAIIRTLADIHNLLGAEMSVPAQQKLEVVLLNARAEVISVHEVCQGMLDSAQMRVTELLRPTVRETILPLSWSTTFFLATQVLALSTSQSHGISSNPRR